MLLLLEHFSLQLAYARKAVELLNISLEQALMEFTQYWIRVNDASYLSKNHLEWSFDATTPDWQALCVRVQNGEPADQIAYDLYQRNYKDIDNDEAYFGCFRFDFATEAQGESGNITLHFHNRDHSAYGPLSKERQSERLQDLRKMFMSIKQRYQQAKNVNGGSWLYNIEAYKRLFPASFITHMKVEKVPFPRSSGIWGQFINSEGALKRDMADAFLTRVNQAQTKDQLLDCFEFKIFYPRAKIEDFYNHFGIG